MKTTNIKAFTAILAVLLSVCCISCKKQEEPQARRITLKASIEKGTTKGGGEMAEYVDDEGIKASWQPTDVIYVFDQSGNATEFTIESIDGRGIATFSGMFAGAEGSPITAVLKNSAVNISNYSRSNGALTADLSRQTGTLQDAGNHELLFGQGTFRAAGVEMEFTHKTSILKFQLTLPSSDRSAYLSSFWLSSGKTGDKTYRNNVTVNIASGEVQSVVGPNDGDINIPTGRIVPEGGQATVYLSVPAYPLQSAILQCIPSCDASFRYVWRIAGASEALVPEPGYSYTITRTSVKTVQAGNVWVDDSALEVNGVSIPRNITGNPYLTRVTTDLWGYKYNYNVLQIEEKDFAGDYVLEVESSGAVFTGTSKGTVAKATTTNNSKAAYGSVGGVTAGNYYDSGWAFSRSAGASTPISFAYAGGKLTAKLYENLVMPASVAIDRAARTAAVTLEIENKAYRLTSGIYSGEYAAYETELVRVSGGQYELGFANGGAFSYKGSVEMDGSDMKITFAKDRNCTAYNTYNVRGILVNRFATATTDGANLIRSTASLYAYTHYKNSGAAYALAIQGTFYLSKAAGTADAGSITADGYEPIN